MKNKTKQNKNKNKKTKTKKKLMHLQSHQILSKAVSYVLRYVYLDWIVT